MKKPQHKMFQSDLKSSTNCGISDSPEPKIKEDKEANTRPRGGSCPTAVPLLGSEDSSLDDVSLPKSDYNTPRPRNQRKGNVLTRIASKLLRRKSKKDSLRHTSDDESQIRDHLIQLSVVDMNWENEMLYSTIEDLKLKDLLVHQQVLQHADYSIFLVRHLLQTSDQVFYLMVVLEESHLEQSQELEIVDHPNVLRLRAVFRAIGKVYMLFDVAVNLFLPFFRNELKVEKIPVYLAQLLLAIEQIQSSPTMGDTFRLSSERIFVDTKGSLQVMAMIDWKKSEAGKAEDLQKGLKYSAMLYASPGRLIGERCADDIWWSFGVFAYQLLVGHDPYENERVESIFKLMDPSYTLTIPPFLDDVTKNFLQSLLAVPMESRLHCAEDIRSHAFFASVDWDNIYDVILPAVTGTTYLSVLSDPSPNKMNQRESSASSLLPDESIRDGQPLDTLIAPALKNDWAGFTLRQANVDSP